MVNIEIEEGIGKITFGTAAHNSLPSSVLMELTEAITGMGNNPAVKVIVLKSEGEKTFCAGASFDELAAILDEATGLRFFSGFANVINAC